MKKIILCAKSVGNTHYVCDNVTKELGIDFDIVNENSELKLNDYDVVIFSSGVYGNHIHKNIVRFIDKLELENINKNAKFYCFLTWIGRGKSNMLAFKEMKDMLNKKGIKLEDNFVNCFGKMKFIRMSHPNLDDCKKIKMWVEEL